MENDKLLAQTDISAPHTSPVPTLPVIAGAHLGAGNIALGPAVRLMAIELTLPPRDWCGRACKFWSMAACSVVLVTLQEVLAGMALGVCAATLLGYLLAKSPSFERFLAPYIVASQSVPVVAIAPLLIIWFGPGLLSKLLICALIVFFPVLINTIVGLRSVPEELQELMRSLRATRLQTITYLEVPAACRSSKRLTGATLSVIGGSGRVRRRRSLFSSSSTRGGQLIRPWYLCSSPSSPWRWHCTARWLSWKRACSPGASGPIH
jgi:hypothetical protein